MDELNNLINETTEEIKSEASASASTSAAVKTDEQVSASPTSKNTPTETETEAKRKELLLLSSDGEFPKSVSFIDKASAKVIEKLYAEYEAKRLEKNVVFLCDLAISKFAQLLGGLDAIERPDEMEKELKNNPLLKKDLKVVMTWLTPFIPFLGVLSGGVTVGKHVWEKRSKSEKRSDQSEKQSEQSEAIKAKRAKQITFFFKSFFIMI